jgi:hypothetical protein
VARVSGAALVCLLSFAAIGVAVRRAARLPLRVYLPSLVLPNIGRSASPLVVRRVAHVHALPRRRAGQ